MMNFFNHLNVGLVEFHIFGAWSPTYFCTVEKKKKKVLVSVVVLAFRWGILVSLDLLQSWLFKFYNCQGVQWNEAVWIVVLYNKMGGTSFEVKFKNMM